MIIQFYFCAGGFLVWKIGKVDESNKTKKLLEERIMDTLDESERMNRSDINPSIGHKSDDEDKKSEDTFLMEEK